MHTSARYATQASNPRRADKVLGRPATHTCAPCLGQLCRVAAHYCGLDSASTHHSAEPTRSRSPGRTDTAAAAAAAATAATTPAEAGAAATAATAAAATAGAAATAAAGGAKGEDRRGRWLVRRAGGVGPRARSRASAAGAAAGAVATIASTAPATAAATAAAAVSAVAYADAKNSGCGAGDRCGARGGGTARHQAPAAASLAVARNGAANKSAAADFRCQNAKRRAGYAYRSTTCHRFWGSEASDRCSSCSSSSIQAPGLRRSSRGQGGGCGSGWLVG